MSAMVILPQAALAAVLNKNAEATAPNTFIENLIFIFFLLFLIVFSVQKFSTPRADYSKTSMAFLVFFR
jgi:hypothetical protein